MHMYVDFEHVSMYVCPHVHMCKVFVLDPKRV